VSRVEPREVALSALYAADAQQADTVDVTGLGRKAATLAAGVWSARDDIDAILARYASGWRVERMPVVDRNVLRLGTFELVHTDTPVGVVVSQAVELAKRFSTERSGKFVNGVLGRIAEDERDGI
jgi:N utilization substance protein B